MNFYLFLFILLPFTAMSQSANEEIDIEEVTEIEDENWASAYPRGKFIDFGAQISDQTYKICFVGDTGTGFAAQKAVAKALTIEKCDQIRILGDVIYEFGLQFPLDPQAQMKFFGPYQAILQQQPPATFFWALGNHDYFGSPDSYIQLAETTEKVVFPSRYYYESWGDICFFTLDTTPYVKGNASLWDQTIWFREAVASLKSTCRFSVVLAHHPYLSVGIHGDATGEMRDFYENEIIGKFDLVIGGHDHNQSDEGETDNTRLLVSGAGGKLRALRVAPEAGNWAESNLGYMVLTVNREGSNIDADYTFVVVEPQNYPRWKFWRWFNKQYVKRVAWQGQIMGRGIR